MDIPVEAVDGAAVPVQPPVGPPPVGGLRAAGRPRLTTAEYRAMLEEMAKGPAPNYVEGTFRREDIYGDESESDSLDEPLGYVTAPVLKTVEATLVCVGVLAPMPMTEPIDQRH